MKTTLDYLETFCDEISPQDFYREIFPEGELDIKDAYTEGMYTAVAVSVGADKKIQRYTVTDNLETIEKLTKTDDFCIMSPISYAGKSRKSENARFLYAMAIDLDGLKEEDYKGYPIGIQTLFHQFDGHGPSNYLPKPTMIVMSGSGLHLYYVFEKPIPLFKNVVEQLEKYKRRLTWQLWTQGVSELQERVQYESLFQGFRMPGTITKSGGRARAFVVDRGDKVTMEYMNQFVPEEFRTTDFSYKSKLTLAQAQKKYPEWHKKRIVEKQPKGTWVASRNVYEWWLRKMMEGAEDGHRYWCVMALATYAKKCGVPREELEADAMDMLLVLDARGKREDNPFTEDDILAALEAYNDSYITYPVDVISYRTGIQIQKNKRNGRRQSVHMKIMSSTRDILYPEGEWRNKDGRPSMERVVEDWRRRNPGGRKADCIRDTGLDKKTVYKWWTP